MTFQSFLREAKRLSNRSEECWLALLYLLLETEQKGDIWRPHYRSWNELLETEGLCSVKHYRAFKLIQGELSPKAIRTLGVYAAINIGRITNKDRRSEVTQKTLRWISRHKVRPTYQRISEYLKPSVKRERTTARFDYKRLYKEQQEEILALKAKVRSQALYIRLLKTTLKEHGCPIPSNPGR